MEANPYEYDKSLPWIAQQQQVYANREGAARVNPTPAPLRQQTGQRAGQQRQQSGGNQGQKPKPMPKARALDMVRALKKGLLIASFVGFGSFSGLVAFHQVATATATTTTTSQSSQTTSTSSSDDDGGGFLKQNGDNTGTSSTTSGASNGSSSTSSGTTSGSSTSSSGTSSSSSTSSAPVSGTHTS